MRKFSFLLIFCVALCARSKPNPMVKMETPYGDIQIEIFEKQAPITAANFLKYVDENRFAEAHFYRVVRMDNQPNNDVKIEVVQGGLGWDEHPKRMAAIAHETTKQTGILHINGALSMARGEPGTADAEFFFCIGDQPELDFGGHRNPDGQGFAAFGQVREGIDVLKKIQNLEDSEQMLVEKVPILKISRMD